MEELIKGTKQQKNTQAFWEKCNTVKQDTKEQRSLTEKEKNIGSEKIGCCIISLHILRVIIHIAFCSLAPSRLRKDSVGGCSVGLNSCLKSYGPLISSTG